MITWANSDPVAVANSEIYPSGKLPTGEQITDLLDDLIAGNTFVKCKGGSLEITQKDDLSLIDLGYFDQARRRAQEKKKVSKCTDIDSREPHCGPVTDTHSKVGGVSSQVTSDGVELCMNHCNLSECIAS